MAEGKDMTEETGRGAGAEVREAAAEFIRRVDEELGEWEFPAPPALLPDGKEHDFSFLLHDEESHGGIQENCEIMVQHTQEEVYRTLQETASAHPALEQTLNQVFAPAADAAWAAGSMAARAAATGMSLLDRPDPRFSGETRRLAMRAAALTMFNAAAGAMLGTYRTVIAAAREQALAAAAGPDPLAMEMQWALGAAAGQVDLASEELRNAMDQELSKALPGSIAALRRAGGEPGI